MEGGEPNVTALSRQDDVPLVSESADSSVTFSESKAHFHSGEKLTITEINKLAGERPIRMLYCVGALGCGKTTLMARIGELFQEGRFQRYSFVGSLTLCAFERASWHATIASGNGEPATERTTQLENDTFLHLRVRNIVSGGKLDDVVITDLAGESFSLAISSAEFCEERAAFHSCNSLLLFLDSKALADKVRKHSELKNIEHFLSRVATLRQNIDELHIHVIFSRWDLLENQGQNTVNQEFCKHVKTRLMKQTSSFASIKFWEIAARPESGKPTDNTIQEMFDSWISGFTRVPYKQVINGDIHFRDFSAFRL